MSDSFPRASVIIRTKNSSRTLGRVLGLLRAQTVPTEIIVVDSGSSDDTLAIASAHVDRVVEIPAEDFSFGRALNMGAATARAPIHMALSSHSFPPDERWIERSLSKYDRSDVAATSGALTPPGSQETLCTTFYQTLPIALKYPLWGLSNTGSSWRADVWASFPFDEQLPTCEDKEWGFRVLADGWTIAIDPALVVSDTHRREPGIRHLYRRMRREFEVISSFAYVPPFTIGDLIRQWADVPAHVPYRGWRRRLNYFRFVELVAKYHGLRASSGSASRPTSPASSLERPFTSARDPANDT